MQTAAITGITGMDGALLCEFLLNNGYKVYGLKRRSSTLNTSRIDHIYVDPHIDNKLELSYGDLSDYSSLVNWVGDIKPDLLFNTGAQSHVKVSFDIPEYTMDITGTGVVRLLEAVRKASPKTRFLQCSSSEMYGKNPPPQNEATPFHPRSPYGVAKVCGYFATINYRESYNLFASNAITFNHDAEKRGENFFLRKLTMAATRIKLGLQNKLYCGNLEAKRDILSSHDAIRGMYQIIMADAADDFVMATGIMHSMRELTEKVFSKLDMDYEKYIEFDQRYARPAEVDALCGNYSKIKNKLGWEPTKSIDEILDSMITHDMKLAEQELLIKNANNKV